LANLEGEIIGDPLEKATLNALEWTVTRGDTVVPVKGRAGRWQIYQRYHFLSALKRMSVIAGQSPSPSSNETTYIVAVKGAPETLKPMVSYPMKFLFERKMDLRRMTYLNDCHD
jgi:cation-transporting ATPase 13A1